MQNMSIKIRGYVSLELRVLSLRVLSPLLLSLLLLSGGYAQAYSYAAAGKEPLIDGREIILSALNANDFNAAAQGAAGLKKEFAYLLKEHNIDLFTPMQEALASKDASAIKVVLDKALEEEIVRRLEGAQNNLGDYQVAKVLVVKSKLFLDLLLPNYDEKTRAQANLAIQGVLTAIGNPGVFGVGQAPADENAFKVQRDLLMKTIQTP
ncbi:hypothetical protein PCNPT3_10070 [Psychromonas sp. CNPT3]|uniref:hypothetical protein n=1 Tax=Psychromonas sp. CNPT3 TaxID=314282 RepID=UPI00006E5864|nr:hypothetical protein [Psychromonas sp. CNPT3]AGH81952.1 hypothetical protein PCNPT3_10070 [Psychromonas sp. CNPT3]